MKACRRGAAVLALVSAFALAATASAWGKEREDLPRSLATPFRIRGETMVADSTTAYDVYSVVLRWYRPPRGQVRWLDGRLLPEAQGSPARRLPAGAMQALLAACGPAFATWAEPRAYSRSGGRLRLSPVYAIAPDTARVAVLYELLPPYARGPSWVQVFLLARGPAGWRITVRGAAGDPVHEEER